MPRLRIQHNAGEQFKVGAELDWEFSIDGFDACDYGWEVSGDGLRWTRLDVDGGAIQVPPGTEGCFLRATIAVLERDRHDQRILCRYVSDAWGPISEAI